MSNFKGGPRDLDEILKERARALARPLETDIDTDGAEFLVLSVRGERYGVPLSSVVQTQPLESLAPVPGIPPFWAGVANVRGTLHPVLDLARYFELAGDVAIVDTTMLVLVSAAGLVVGLMVDAVEGIHRISDQERGPALSEASTGGQRAVSSMTSALVALLDLEELLSDPRLIVQEEASVEHPAQAAHRLRRTDGDHAARGSIHLPRADEER